MIYCKTINLSKIIPATEHLILLEVFSRDLLQPFVPTLAGNFLLLLEMEYPVEPQFDTVPVKDLQVADSAANVKVLEMLVGLDSQFYALRFVLSVIISLIFKSEINWAQKILFPLGRQQLTHNYSCHLRYSAVVTFSTVNTVYFKFVKQLMYHNIIPATEHLILLRACSKDLLLPFVLTLAGNFLLLLKMKYLVEPQFDTVLEENLQVADSAANVKALEMVL